MKYMVMTKRRFFATFLLLSIILCCLLVIVDEAVGAFVQISVSSQKRSLPIYSVETDKQLVALGINCAWDNADIPIIIEILDKYKIKATFFVVGDWVSKYPESVKLLYDNGHEIQNHSTTHADMTKLSREEIIKEINDTSNRVKEITGDGTTILRPPSGAYNNLVVETARGIGHEVVQWDVDSIDWKGLSVDEIYSRVTTKVKNGSITLFHSGKENTPKALDRIIQKLQNDGYNFVKVGDMIYKGEYTINEQGTQKQASDLNSSK